MEQIDEVLSEQQHRQTDAIASLVLKADQASIKQGVELAAALNDQAVFAALLAGVEPQQLPKKTVGNRRYPTLRAGQILEPSTVGQAWMVLAMAHLLAVSELPLRTELASLALGGPKKPLKPDPQIWLAGLERLTSLTHLDLYFSATDRGVDLSDLQRFPRLTHLRMRGPGIPGPLPSLEHLEFLQASDVEFDPDAEFPALKTIKARLHANTSLRQSNMPSLVDVEVRGDVKLYGFESLGMLLCNGGVELSGCERVDRLQFMRGSIHAPELRHVGELIGAGAGFELAQLETLGAVQFSRTTKFAGGTFPPGTALLHPKIAFWGPTLTDLGNVGELPGLEILHLVRVSAPISLETLRHAKSLRVLDIRDSPGITDLSPLVGLRNIEVVILSKANVLDIPDELADKIERVGEKSLPRRRPASRRAKSTRRAK